MKTETKINFADDSDEIVKFQFGGSGDNLYIEINGTVVDLSAFQIKWLKEFLNQIEL